MRVLLINPKSETTHLTWRRLWKMKGCRTMFPPLGLLTVAAMLPPDWELRLVDMETRTLNKSHWDWAEVIMISGMIIQKRGILSLIKEAKSRGKCTVVGGHYATSFPEECLEAGCDFMVMGEAENTMNDLVSALEKGHQKGIFENDSKPDMTQCTVIPRFDLLNPDDYMLMGVQISRGCPHDCEFCQIPQLQGRNQRWKAPAQVALFLYDNNTLIVERELSRLYEIGWCGDVLITDDNFIGNRKLAVQMLGRIIEWSKSHGEPFVFHVQASLDLGQDLELVDLMTEANFSSVWVGIETPDKDILEHANKRQNIRNPILESIENIRDNGLLVMAHFVVGFDHEPSGISEQVVSLVERTHIPLVFPHILQALPNSRLWKRLEASGRLLAGRTTHGLLIEKPNFVPTRPEKEICEDYNRIWYELYNTPQFLSRTYHYYSAMRPTRRALTLQRGEVPSVQPSGSGYPIKKHLGDVKGFMMMLWRQVIMGSHRAQFWRQHMEIRKYNPSRWYAYLRTCAIGESMHDLMSEIQEHSSRC